LLNHALVFRDMDHANVLKIIGHCVEAPPFLTVLESCPDVSCYIVIDIITHTHTRGFGASAFLFWSSGMALSTEENLWGTLE